MRAFTRLFTELDSSTKTTEKQNALIRYFETASDRDKVWAIALFTHRRPKRSVPTTKLREWTAERTKFPAWLIEDCYHLVGDLAETLALFNGQSGSSEGEEQSLDYWIRYLYDLRDKKEIEKRDAIEKAWDQLVGEEQFILNKLITGGFRVGVSSKSVFNALAKHLDEDPSTIALRLTGDWDPFEISFEELVVNPNLEEQNSKPFPFYLAYALEDDVSNLGKPDDWFAEWKWDGIRSQLVCRNGEVNLWSRGEEIITDSFPEFKVFQGNERDFVIDGELIVWRDGKPALFQDLQKRIGRKKPGKKILEDYPCLILCYDILELDRVDLREESQSARRAKLEELISSLNSEKVLISPLVDFKDWKELEELRLESRERDAEGLMLKSRSGTYKVGRKRGDWWKWKVDPMTIDAVMIYAQSGHGRRANLYTDFTFAVWDGDRLVTFAKAYSGLTDAEFREVNQFIKANTIERFGPVRSVKPELVFELAFEGIAPSTRHKSGVALRFPRIKRWRKDKPAKEANTLGDLYELLR